MDGGGRSQESEVRSQEPALHTANLGIHFIIRRVNNAVHSIQVNQGKDRENIRLVERIASKRADLIQVSLEVSVSEANGARLVRPPLPIDEMGNGQLLCLAFATHDNSVHVFTQCL